jgi:hypothetical protein
MGVAVCPKQPFGVSPIAVRIRLKSLVSNGWEVENIGEFHVATKPYSAHDLTQWPPTGDLLNAFQFLIFENSRENLNIGELFGLEDLQHLCARTVFTPSAELLKNLERHAMGLIFTPAFEFRQRGLTWITPRELDIEDIRNHTPIAQVFEGARAHEALTYAQ